MNVSKKHIIGGLITLFTLGASTTFANSPERCSPYPLCKFMDAEKTQVNNTLRLMEPVGKLQVKSEAEQKTNTENELVLQKEESLEK